MQADNDRHPASTVVSTGPGARPTRPAGAPPEALANAVRRPAHAAWLPTHPL